MTFVPSASRKGFTLIELLVVIAIIGILSSVVLASLNTARSKGTDAKIMSELRAIAVNAELYYDSNNSYGATGTDCAAGMFAASTPTNIAAIIADLTNAVGGSAAPNPVCRAYAASGSTATSFFVGHQLTSNTALYFCVDSTGRATTTATAITTSLTACPGT